MILLFFPGSLAIIIFISSSFIPSSSSSSSSASCSSSSSASLPPHCHCAGGHSLVCSCASSSSSPSSSSSSSSSSSPSVLRLSPSALPDHLHQLIIHSCPHVLIPSGAFRGKTIKDQIKFLDISRLDFESGALRGIRHSPRLLLIQNSHLRSISPLAFAGLAHLQHFWWRNVTIGRIRSRAFAKMAFVDYLYFHNAHIKSVETGSFCHIHQLGHLFFRDRIRIDNMARGAFAGTRMDALVMEGASVKADEGVFAGMRARRVRMSGCWWGEAGGGKKERMMNGKKKRRRRKRKVDETRTELGEVVIRNCTLYSLPFIGDAFGTLQIEHSIIGNLVKGRGAKEEEEDLRMNAAGGRQIGKENEMNSTRMPSYSTSSAAWHNSSSSSTSLVPRPPSLPSVRIFHSRIRVLSIPHSSSSSSSSSPSSILIRNSSILRWSGSPFSGSLPIGQFLIDHSRLLRFSNSSPGPFSGLNLSRGSLRIVQTHLGQNFGAAAPFSGSKFDILEMANCRLDRAPANSFLDGIEVRERMTVRDTQWPCGGDGDGGVAEVEEGCGMEELLLASIPHRISHWQFISNQCFGHGNSSSSSPSSSSSFRNCELSSSSSHSADGFLCRRLGPLQECLCRHSLPPHPLPPPHPSSSSLLSSPSLPLPIPSSSSIRILLIGDCADHSPSILLDHPSSSPSQLHSLYIFRVHHLIIRSLPPSLRHLHILHSSARFSSPAAFSGSHLFELTVEQSHLVKGQWKKQGMLVADKVRMEGTKEEEEEEEDEEGMMMRRREAEGARGGASTGRRMREWMLAGLATALWRFLI